MNIFTRELVYSEDVWTGSFIGVKRNAKVSVLNLLKDCKEHIFYHLGYYVFILLPLYVSLPQSLMMELRLFEKQAPKLCFFIFSLFWLLL